MCDTKCEIKTNSGFSAKILRYTIAVAVVVVLFWFGFTCVVREGNCAIIFRFGAVRTEIAEAGIYLKLPWPFETVVTFDDRLQYLKAKALETTTKDKRNIILQSSVIWKIENPILYYNSVGVNNSVETYINDQVFSATNSTLGAYELTSLVSTNKEEIKIEEIQNEIYKRVKENCLKNYGIDIVDVSIMTLSLPTNNLKSIFDQMTADRQKAIDTIISNAKTQANKIESDADVEAAKIKAEGITKAAEINAKAETEVAKIYAQAQQTNIELYKFLKELDTVIASVNKSSILVVKADEYPFNILKKYSSVMKPGSNEIAINDLNYIMTQLNNEDRDAVTSAISNLLAEEAKSIGEPK